MNPPFFFELYNPGSILPGVVGGIALILAFYALHTLPVHYAGLLLIIFSIILFVAEIKIPSYGMLTVGGIVSLFFGSTMLFDEGSTPFIEVIEVSMEVIIFATVITTLFFLFAIGLGLRAQRRKPVTGQEGLVGETGEAVEDFSKGKGQVAVHGEIWEASCDSPIKKGDTIVVTSIENLKIIVKKVT